MARKKSNKSQRIREYIAANAEASNSEVASALSQHGVNYGDVASVRNALKKQAAKLAGNTDGTAGTPAARRGRPPKSGTSVGKSKAISSPSTDGSAVESAMRFINDAGGIEKASELLTIIRAVKSYK